MSEAVQLSEIADIVRGISFPKEAKSLEPRPGDVACLRTSNVQKQVEWDNLWFVPAVHVKRNEQYVQAGDILISTANSYELVGKVAPVTAVPHKATLGAFISLIRPREGVEPKYLYHQLAWGKTQSRIRETASTTTNISNVSTKKLMALEFSIPPMDEQQSIVAEIEKQFSRLDEAVAGLQRVKTNLKRYKASVLKSAVAGRLVETEADLARREGRRYETGAQLLQRILDTRRRQWQGKGKYKEPAAPDTTDLPELPEGWTWANPDILAMPTPESIGAGPFGTIFKAKDFRPSGVPIIFLRHVAPGQYLTHKPGFMDSSKWEELFKPYSVFGGELLITKLGDPPGVCAIYPMGVGPAMVTPDVIKMVADENVVLSSFLLHYFNSEVARRFSTGAAFGTTRLRLTLPIFRTMPVPLPPVAEQHRIVAEVDRLLSIAREAEAEVEANLKRAQGLRQATLQQAFSSQ